MAARTPSQTVGPFFHEALRWKAGGDVTFPHAGERIVITGRMTDGAGEPVGDAMIETWQGASAAAREGKPHGFGRVETAKDGTFRIETAKPAGPLPAIDVTLFARGLLKALRTRVYLAEESIVRTDPLLAPLAASPRLATLVARSDGRGQYRWDVRLQGDGETVFFDA